MTILSNIVEKSGLDILGYSSVWDFHNRSLYSVANRKASNLNNSLKAIIKSGYDGIVTIYAYKIGRSQHSETQLVILKGVTNLDDVGTDVYYSQRHEEIRLDLLK